MATVTVNKSVSDVNALVGRGLVSVRCVSGARPMRGVGEPRVRPAAAPPAGDTGPMDGATIPSTRC